MNRHNLNITSNIDYSTNYNYYCLLCINIANICYLCSIRSNINLSNNTISHPMLIMCSGISSSRHRVIRIWMLARSIGKSRVCRQLGVRTIMPLITSYSHNKIIITVKIGVIYKQISVVLLVKDYSNMINLKQISKPL